MTKLSRVSKYYDDTEVVDTSVLINEGQIYGFVELNGSRKNSTIKTIMRYIKNNISSLNLEEKNNIGYLPSDLSFDDDLTVSEMIGYNDTFYHNQYFDDGIKYASLLNLDLNKKINNLSMSNLKKLGFVLTLMHNPKIIVIDEPINGLDAKTQDELISVLNEEKKRGKIIFISSRNLVEISKICDQIGLVEDGQIEKIISINELMKNEYMIVTIFCKDIKKKRLPLKDMMIKTLKDNEIKFIYKNNVNELIKILANIKIDKMLIEETNLEDILLYYYSGKKDLKGTFD